MYVSLFHSVLRYGIIFWGAAPQCRLNRVLILQKKAIRIVANKEWNYHTEGLFRDLNILRLDKLYEFELCNFIYRTIHITNRFALDSVSQIHSYNTRNRENIYLHPVHFNVVKGFVLNRGVSSFNALPVQLKHKAYKLFKGELNRILL